MNCHFHQNFHLSTIKKKKTYIFIWKLFDAQNSNSLPHDTFTHTHTKHGMRKKRRRPMTSRVRVVFCFALVYFVFSINKKKEKTTRFFLSYANLNRAQANIIINLDFTRLVHRRTHSPRTRSCHSFSSHSNASSHSSKIRRRRHRLWVAITVIHGTEVSSFFSAAAAVI